MGTLYVVGVPAGNRNDLTLRARRILNEARQIVAEDVEGARALLADHAITSPLIGVPDGGAGEALLQQGDLALVACGWPGEAGWRLVSAAADGGYQVAAVPGPALPITALILSGLPADTFLHLGALPAEREARRRWLSPISGESRTLVALASPPLAAVLSDLWEALGDRPLAVMPASERRLTWRGSLATAKQTELSWPQVEGFVLVIGGAREELERWDESQLVAEIETRLAGGQRAKEISRQLADRSGWSRRRIYDLVVEITRAGPQRRSCGED